MAPPSYKGPMAPHDYKESPPKDERLSSYIGGIACRLPKSPNVEALWENLINKVDMVDETRWPVGVYGLPHRCGTIEDVDEFDNCFFDLSINEANDMPCMLRLLLEVIYESIIDSGIPRETLSKSRTGLYLAINFCEEQEINRGMDNSDFINIRSEFVYRIFSILDLSGPAVSVDTACCSSLSALQMANMDLHNGRCDYAIVAGANLLDNLNHSIQFYKLGMLSPNGQSSPFDKKANGYVRSEGLVAILLSSRPRLHRIYAKIDHVLCFSDGYKEAGILSPSEKDQISLLQEIYKDRYPAYVEAHATGTQLGDETELKALKNAFGDKLKRPLLLGSCKSNLGHTEACAGLVGILKCVLSIHHGMIPPNINLDSPHSLLTESDPWAKVVTKETKIPDGFIGVSCFGFGGVIGHVILEQISMNIINIPKYVLLPVKLQAENQSKKIINYVNENLSRTDTLCLMATASFCIAPDPEFRGYIKILNDDMLVDVKEKVYDQQIWLVLNDFFFTDQSIFDEDYLQVESIRNSFAYIQSILRSMGSDIILANILHQKESERRLKDKFFLGAVTLIAYLELLMLCNFKPDRILGIGLSEIILAYYDDCISLENCLKILYLIANNIENNTATFDERTYFVKQRAEKTDEKISLVAAVDKCAVFVNIPRPVAETLKVTGDWLEILPPIQTYWQPQMDKGLSLKLNNLLLPKERSARWVSCVTARDISLKDHRQFGPHYITHLLTHPIDLSLINIPKDGTVFFLNGDKRLRHLFVQSEPMNITYCSPNCSAVLSTLGNLHLLTDDIDVSKVNPDLFPLDHRAPPIGHLLMWNHETWTTPEWQHYCISIKDQFVSEFPVGLYDEFYEPMPILIVNLLEVIQEPMCAICVEFTHIIDFNRKHLDGALIAIHEGVRKIATYTEDEEILICFFEYMEKLPDHLILNYNDAKSVSVTIEYDGTLVDFINFAYKHGCSKFESSPVGFFFDEKLHNERAGKILNIEYETGICQAGGFVFKFPPKHLRFRQIKEEAVNILVTSVLLYNISQQTDAYVVIYSGSNEDESLYYLGVCLLADEYEFVQKQIQVPRKLALKDISKIIPYLISNHLLNEVLSLNKQKSLVIHPQYDSLSMYIAIIAKDICKHVYVCSWGEEIANDIQELIPEVSVLSAQNVNNVLYLTKGRGFDAAIKLQGNDLSRAFLSLADGGCMVLCSKPNCLEDLKLSVFLKNVTFKVTEPLNAVVNFLLSDESWEGRLMTTMDSERFSDLWDSDFLKEPSNAFEIILSSDLDNIRLSTVIPYLKFKRVDIPERSVSPADEAFTQSLVEQLIHIIKTTFSKPEAISSDSPPFKIPKESESSSPSESPITSPEPLYRRKPHCRALTASLNRFTRENEHLFILKPPRSPYSPKIEEFMKVQTVLVPLNSKTGDRPLIFIHPITGVVSLLRNLGSKLSVPCYGIQMTESTPKTSITDMASFYVKTLLHKFPKGPYRLAGYSFGACVALEMALQMQSYLEVELLLMLDGSPRYIEYHCEYIQEEVSGIATKKSEKEYIESGYMVSFVEMYKPMDKERRALFLHSLVQEKTTEDKIAFVLDFLHGKTIQSPGTAKMNWLTVSHNMMNKPSTDFVSTTKEVLRTSRNKKCMNYIDNCKMAEDYKPDDKFKGSIHLFRIKKEPERCVPLPTDYGITEICSDTLVRFYDGDHNTFLNEAALHKDIEKILESLKDSDQ